MITIDKATLRLALAAVFMGGIMVGHMLRPMLRALIEWLTS